jgi:hypothetical protein
MCRNENMYHLGLQFQFVRVDLSTTEKGKKKSRQRLFVISNASKNFKRIIIYLKERERERELHARRRENANARAAEEREQENRTT